MFRSDQNRKKGGALLTDQHGLWYDFKRFMDKFNKFKSVVVRNWSQCTGFRTEYVYTPDDEFDDFEICGSVIRRIDEVRFEPSRLCQTVSIDMTSI